MYLWSGMFVLVKTYLLRVGFACWLVLCVVESAGDGERGEMDRERAMH